MRMLYNCIVQQLLALWDYLLSTWIIVSECDQRGLPGGPDGKESACNAGDLSVKPGSGRSAGEGNGYPLQYSCLENPMDRGAQIIEFLILF